ncbi:MAG: TlpA family protein disulfide reductase [Saprospiraceae bacterium]|nr:TlpA family protein disulfide reductase [Saprospiraceae bacterium]
MRLLTFSVLFLAICSLIGCTPEKPIPDATLVVNLANTGSDKLELFNIEKEIHQELAGEKDSIALALSDEIILDLSQGRSHSYIHVKPGMQIALDTIASKPIQLGVAEPASKENAYLVSFASISKNQENAYSMRAIAGNEVDGFLIQINEKYAPLAALIAEVQADTKVSESFKSALAIRLTAIKGNDLLNYEGWHNYLKKKYPELPANFYEEIEALNFSDPALLVFEESRQLSVAWATKDLSYDDFSSDAAYFDAALAKVKETYPNTLLGDYCALQTVSDQINYGSGIDGSDEMVEAFRASVSNKYLNDKLNQTLEPWVNLKSGMDAPDFSAFNRDGEPVKLSQLKGKKVYIDVWATWCGPCVKEIPSLKALESELHEEDIVFVSVSIDKEADKEKWLSFIAKEELQGVQLMAKDDWKSDVASAYNIKGIPRFLLIDSEGKIISANAPRPSDPTIREVLLQ